MTEVARPSRGRWSMLVLEAWRHRGDPLMLVASLRTRELLETQCEVVTSASNEGYPKVNKHGEGPY